MDRAQKTSIRICPVGKNEGKLCYSPNDVRKAAMSAYYQAERDFTDMVCKFLKDELEGYDVDFSDIEHSIKRFKDYIKIMEE